MKIFKFLLNLFPVCFTIIAGAQEVIQRDSVFPEDLVVTAARYPQQFRNLAAPVQLISQATLQSVTTGDISSALASVPGVQLQSGTFQTMKLTLRGIGSRSQYSTNRTRVYLDDIPLTAGDGTTVFDDIDLSFLSQMEITKGSYAAWHGSGLGGSMRFVTRKSTERNFSADAGITAGSFGLLKLTGVVNHGFKTGNQTIGISGISGDGYRQNSEFSRKSGLISGDFNFMKFPGKINYLLMYNDVKAFTPSSLDEAVFLSNPKAAAANWLQVKGFKKYQRLLGGLRFESEIGRGWSNILLFTANQYDQYELRPFNILDDLSFTFTAQEIIRYTSEKINLAAGFETIRGQYYWQTRTNTSQEILTDAISITTQLNTFANAAWQVYDRLQITLAANINLTASHLQYKQTPDDWQNHRGKVIFSPMTGINYALTKDISLYCSLGHGFSNPTVEESLTSDGKMNTLLRPEQGITLDAGIRAWFPSPRISLQAAIYSIRLNDLLITVRPDEDTFYGENAGSSSLRGVELNYRQQVNSWFSYHIAGSVSDNQFLNFTENGNIYKGNKLPGIPASQLFAGFAFVLMKNLSFISDFRYQGIQFADDANLVRVKDWQTIQTGIRYETLLLKKTNLLVSFQINNLFNEQYASMILINAPSFSGRNPRYFYPALPRNFAINLQIGIH